MRENALLKGEMIMNLQRMFVYPLLLAQRYLSTVVASQSNLRIASSRIFRVFSLCVLTALI